MSLVHAVSAEHSPIRRRGLYLFARYLEMPLLRCGYGLLRGRYRRLGRYPLVRAALGWGLTAPFGYLGDTAYPLPAAQTLALIDALDGPLAVGPCRCRLAHGACDHPLETDLVIRTGVEAWTRAFPADYRPIDKAEARAIVADCSRLGMWPMVFVHCPVGEHGHGPEGPAQPSPAAPGPAPGPHLRGNEYVICNCCPCGCVPYILNRELGQRVYPLLRGGYVAHTDPARCTGEGACVAACPFGARTVVDGLARLAGDCFGCGVCVAACPQGAIRMRPA